MSETKSEWTGWIDCVGDNPRQLPPETIVDVMCRDGAVLGPARADFFAGWKHEGIGADIVAYRFSEMTDWESDLRDLFAAHALTGLLSQGKGTFNWDDPWTIADLVLARRRRKG